MEKQKPIHLRCTKDNHNKFYDMVQLDDDCFVAFWGKCWTRGQCKVYGIGEWFTKYYEKIDKGYEEVSSSCGEYEYHDNTKKIVERGRDYYE